MFDCLNTFQDDKYSLFFCNNNWYLFLRLHEILCERLYKIREQANRIIAEEAKTKGDRKESTAIALRMKTLSELWLLHNQKMFSFFS